MSKWKHNETLEEVEKQAIKECLEFYDHNRTYTAKALDISIRTLRYKIKRYQLPSMGYPGKRRPKK